jgi:hypothetical protein
MTRSDLGPQPDPVIEPGEPHPGGADAVDTADGVDGEFSSPDPALRDLDPADNPAVEDVMPDEMYEKEDTSTEATEDDEGETNTEPEEESPA